MFPHSVTGRRRRFLAVLFIVAVVFAWPASLWAHPLGNFTVNRYTRLEPGRGQIDIIYVVDMAEIAALQVRQRIDADGDGAIDPAEQSDYLAAATAALQDNLHLEVGGRELPLQAQSQAVSFPSGQGGLSTLRLVIHFNTKLPAGTNEGRASYRDENFAGRLGWQEIVVRPRQGVRIFDATAPAEDISDELRNYPQDLLQNPLALSEASFGFRSGVGEEDNRAATPPQAIAVASARGGDPFTTLLDRPIADPGALLLALILAFGWGAAHALTPGHGKTVVGAYLVGSRGTARHALFLGLATTLTHTAGVFALGLITLFASRYILPEQLYPWLSALSGLLVVILGLNLLRDRLHTWRHGRQHALGAPHTHPDHAAHSHLHDHHHDTHAGDPHPHHHDHDHGHHKHSHLPPGANGERVTWRRLLALGISGGLVPCPSALVVMLGAIALQRVGLGLLLIVAFSLGLAGVLTAIGLIFVHAGRLVERLPMRGRLLPALPLASAALVVLLGLGITWRALAQTGTIAFTAFSLSIP